MKKNDNSANSAIWSPGFFALLLSTGMAAFFVAFYLYIIKAYLLLPADILIWAESNFVGDIIKLRIGDPLYTDPADSNAGIYSFASPVLTYSIAWIIGKSTSIPLYRMIQLLFAACAALVATGCCRMVHRHAYPNGRIPFPRTWWILTFLGMFLIATAPGANGFAHCLHTEALALLISALSFWTVLYYHESPSRKRLVLMSIFPVLGFLTKQILLAWAFVMFVFLVFRNPRDIKTWAVFWVTTAAFFAIALGLCYLQWGDNFIFWIFRITGGGRKEISFSPYAFNLSLARSVDHTLRLWPEISVGILGVWLLLREHLNIRKLGPILLGWIVLLSFEALSSGVAWNVLWHFGPAIFIGGILMFSALPRIWPSNTRNANSEFAGLLYWGRALMALAGLLTFFTIMNVVPTGDRDAARYWKRRPPPDVYRYISDIEREFEGLPAEKVLLDIGNWIYLRHSVLAKDRAISLADQPVGGIYENFAPMVRRLRDKTYQKILVRDLDSPFFLYDWAFWERSSGVRKTLRENYREIRTIPAVQGNVSGPPRIMYTGVVSVLIPKKPG